MQLLSLAQLQRSALHTGMALSLFTGLAPSLTCYEMLAAQSTLQYKPQRFLVFLADNIVGGAFALAMASWELGANRVVNVAAAVLYLAAYAWAAGGHRGWHVLGSAAALALAASACCAAVLHWRSSDDATALLGSVSTASGSVQALLPLLQLPTILSSGDARSIPVPWVFMSAVSGTAWLVWSWLARNPYTAVSCLASAGAAYTQLAVAWGLGSSQEQAKKPEPMPDSPQVHEAAGAGIRRRRAKLPPKE